MPWHDIFAPAREKGRFLHFNRFTYNMHTKEMQEIFSMQQKFVINNEKISNPPPPLKFWGASGPVSICP